MGTSKHYSLFMGMQEYIKIKRMSPWQNPLGFSQGESLKVHRENKKQIFYGL
jgi:hypothetical protein